MKSLDRVAATKVVGTAGILVILLLGYFLVLSPRLGEVDEIQTQADDVRSNNQVVAAEVADLEQKKADLGTERRTAEELERRFPPRAVQADMFADVRDSARRAGIEDVDVTALTPTPPEAAGSAAANGGATLPAAGAAPTTGLASMKLTATVTGTRDQLRRFLAAMEGQDRSYLFDTVEVAPASGEATGTTPTEVVNGGGSVEGAAETARGLFTLTLNGTMFLLPAVVDPDAPPAETATEDAGTAAPADAAPSVAAAP